jgi:hypothetical protein
MICRGLPLVALWLASTAVQSGGEAAPASIAGRVLRADGEPGAAGARIEVKPGRRPLEVTLTTPGR